MLPVRDLALVERETGALRTVSLALYCLLPEEEADRYFVFFDVGRALLRAREIVQKERARS